VLVRNGKTVILFEANRPAIVSESLDLKGWAPRVFGVSNGMFKLAPPEARQKLSASRIGGFFDKMNLQRSFWLKSF
jgi:hypothetical protein